MRSFSCSFFFFFFFFSVWQGLKKGIVELVDLVIVNKADGDLVNAARRAQIEYTSALKLLRPKTGSWSPKVISISSVEHSGIDKAWTEMLGCHSTLVKSGELTTLRSEQRKRWMWRILTDHLLQRFPFPFSFPFQSPFNFCC